MTQENAVGRNETPENGFLNCHRSSSGLRLLVKTELIMDMIYNGKNVGHSGPEETT